MLPLPPRFGHFGMPDEVLAIEVIYFLLVAGMSLYIYIKTKEIYELTRHKGIHHFRNIFLYFALAYLFRLLLIAHLLSMELFNIRLPRHLFPLSLLIAGYFSTMAIFSVVLFTNFRHLTYNENRVNLVLHGVAIISSLLVGLTRSNLALIMLQTGVFLAAVMIVLLKSEKHKYQLSHNKITFISLFVFWVLSTFALERRFLPFELKIPLYILSIIVFFSILLRVNKRLGHAEKKGQA